MARDSEHKKYPTDSAALVPEVLPKTERYESVVLPKNFGLSGTEDSATSATVGKSHSPEPARAAYQATVHAAHTNLVQVVPVTARFDDDRLSIKVEPNSPRAASFRVLRHRLIELGDPTVIMVTSPHHGEGKSMCAANLALAIAEMEQPRVLLIEANLRQPALASMFRFSPPRCFSEQLRRSDAATSGASAWIVAEIAPRLHIAAVDPSQHDHPVLIPGPAIQSAIKQFRGAGYDYLIIDTPSVLDGADVNLLSDLMDGIVLVAWRRKTTLNAISHAKEQLPSGKVVGVVLFE